MTEDADRAGLPPDRFTALLRRIKDHRIAQWTVGYVAVAYGIQHAVTLTSEAFKWPDAVIRISMLLLALGLPVAMTLAWYHGDRTARRISSGELAVVSVVLLGISFAFYLLVRPSAEVASAGDAASRASIAAPASPAVLTGTSLAVLPFANVSGDPNQEYFSDGMTDEIMAALAKVPVLRVVGRESAFQFKGKSADNRAIGTSLGARYLVEGSVRKAGDQVRITAQLVQADNGVSMWTDSYDRELKDVFAVQEDVAKAIAAALQVPLGLRQGESLVPNRVIDPNSYQEYLGAKALIRSRANTPLTAPIAVLERVVARQPNYAPAWALLSLAYDLAPNYDTSFRMGSVEELRRAVAAALPKAEAAARRAIELDPRSADAYAGLGIAETLRANLSNAEQSYKQALRLDPLNPDALHVYSLFLAKTGRIKEALAIREQLRSLEPLVPVFNLNTAEVFSEAGDNTRALAIAQALPPDYGVRAVSIARIYAAMGRYKEAANAALDVPRQLLPPGAVEAAARLLRMAPASAQHENIPDLGAFDFVFAYVGLPERALERTEHFVDAGYYTDALGNQLWRPYFREARKTERFKALVRKLGLVDYWKARGWPDLCHPVGTDDFACN